jgi:hypothetical protein
MRTIPEFEAQVATQAVPLVVDWVLQPPGNFVQKVKDILFPNFPLPGLCVRYHPRCRVGTTTVDNDLLTPQGRLHLLAERRFTAGWSKAPHQRFLGAGSWQYSHFDMLHTCQDKLNKEVLISVISKRPSDFFFNTSFAVSK